MAIEKELLDQLLAGRDPKELFAKNGLLDDLKKALSERILNAELDEHLDGERVDGSFNRRNGTSKKTVLTGMSKIELAVPRDREGRFDPQLIAKYQRRFPDFDEKIISMYARGLWRYRPMLIASSSVRMVRLLLNIPVPSRAEIPFMILGIMCRFWPANRGPGAMVRRSRTGFCLPDWTVYDVN